MYINDYLDIRNVFGVLDTL